MVLDSISASDEEAEEAKARAVAAMPVVAALAAAPTMITTVPAGGFV